MFDKRRFIRVNVDIEAEMFSAAKTSIGKGRAIDVSISGIGVKHTLTQGFRNGGEIFVTFTLPDGTAFDKIRAEVRGNEKLLDGLLLKLRFTEMKVLDAMKQYVEKVQPK